ncbi:MAG TPA: hypothetical protein VD905_12080 [Flavobacteriales bacterium]|nr:hypothetical protein [Flavobacteriales bacterium]
MKKLLLPVALYAITLFSFPACGGGSKETVSNSDSVRAPQLIIGNPIAYSVDSLSIFPVGLSSYTPSEIQKPITVNFKSGSGLAAGSYTWNMSTDASGCVALASTTDANQYNGAISTYSNNNLSKVDIRNLIFYNRFTGQNYKLMNEKLHIISFSIHNEFEKPIIMYHVIKNDFNNDTIYDYRDPVMLYISDLNGKNFTQLSPEKEQYIDYFFYKESNKILLKVRTDTDTNKVFDAYDQSIYREVNLDRPTLGTVLFGEDMISDLKKLL